MPQLNMFLLFSERIESHAGTYRGCRGFRKCD